ncbi:hypothetical protein XVE_0912 [Xanthomonas vesicatoria ATCC 35937]|uniref:Uncharacterized protein n=1 Tax=Xanthomonas vesicatoria ATCC 35937 TaxID=925775 RepID=F0BA08_9XANT|nr:hypothetical protein XVE_0912 [Xanthomonas vesicatoria ATCC 35937]
MPDRSLALPLTRVAPEQHLAAQIRGLDPDSITVDFPGADAGRPAGQRRHRAPPPAPGCAQRRRGGHNVAIALGAAAAGRVGDVDLLQIDTVSRRAGQRLHRARPGSGGK